MYKTLKQAFSELIETRKWYEHSLRSPIQAKNDKASFNQMKNLPEEPVPQIWSVYEKILKEHDSTHAFQQFGFIERLDEAFKELIKERKWYQHSSRSPFQAQNDKAKFRSGKRVVEDHIREYLLSAGYKIIQEEKWVKL